MAINIFTTSFNCHFVYKASKIAIIFVIFLVQGCKRHSILEQSLCLAGENRKELELVLDEYTNLGDSLKYLAACFLIENMQNKFSYINPYLEHTKNALISMRDDNNNIPDRVIDLANSFPSETLIKKYDLQSINADYLIKHINLCFDNWRERPWNKNISFENFCEYLLPYRIGNEPLEDWLEVYAAKYGPLLDSLYTGSDVIEAANLLNMHIGATEKIAFNADIKYCNPGPLFYLDCKSGSCLDLRDLSLYILRSVGIPAVADFYRCSPSNNSWMHTWVMIRDTTGKDVPFRGPGLKVSRELDIEYDKGKIYRTYYGKQNISPKVINNIEIPAFFRSPYIKDVTMNYMEKNEIELEVIQKENEYVYLGVHTDWRTKPIAIAKVTKGKAIFENVEKNLIYQLLSAKGEEVFPAGYPVLFGEDSVHVFQPDTNRMQQIVLHRKFFLAKWLYNYMNYMICGELDGSLDPLFSKKSFFFQVQDSIRDIIVKSFPIDTMQNTRYVRFKSSHNRRIDLSEVSFYTTKGKIPFKKIKLTGGESLGVYKNGALENICDDNPLTYYASADTSATVVFDLGSSVTLSRIDIMPRTDDNFIRIGDLYELYYHAGIDGWKSLGRQVADKYFLEYKEVPGNALLWLQNHTRGQEEQVFFMKGGKQVFTADCK